MSEDRKSIITSHPGATTGGLGAVLTTIVPAIIQNQDSLWRPVLYALAPIVSAIIAYLMGWFISRYGFESSAEAELRKSLNRDLKNIDNQLKNKDLLTDELERELLHDRHITVRQLVNIGKTVKVKVASKVEPSS